MSDNLIATVKTPKGDIQFDYESMANRPKKFVNINVDGSEIAPLEENDDLTLTSSEHIILDADVDNKIVNIGMSDVLTNTVYNIIKPDLISNEIKRLYNMTDDSDINDIFTFFRDTITRHVLEVKVMTRCGVPIEGAVISGLEEDIVTNVNGRAFYRVIAGVTEIELTVTVPDKYTDVIKTKTVPYQPTGTFHQSCDIYMDSKNSMIISTSQSITFSPDVAELSISCAGGGGGGGGGVATEYIYEDGTDAYGGGAGGGGGGGGYVTTETIKLEEKENTLHIVVGAGGAGGKGKEYTLHETDKDRGQVSVYAASGKDGNESYVTLNDDKDTKYALAAGGKGGGNGFGKANNTYSGIAGKGGEGNGAGGNGSKFNMYYSDPDDAATIKVEYIAPEPGKAATDSLYGTDTKVGGGGAGGAGNNESTANGGAPYGGSVTKRSSDSDYNISKPGTGYAGGGAGGCGGHSAEAGADGHSGVVAITWKFRDEITEEKPKEETPTE